ncbi:MAG: PAS domain S-box protein [Comamonadaceae bacterium]|nr:PAS domain S-box protein [Comamonadaceae bacterium]
MPVAALVVDDNGELLEHNGQAERLFALQRPTVAARFLHRFVDREQFQRQVRPAFHQARALGSITLDEVGFITEEGRRFVGELHLSTLPGGGASPQFAAAIIDRTEHLQDVRALRDSAEALRVREAFLAGSARLARVGGWEYDATSGAMRWSPQLRSVFGLGADEPATLARLLEFCCSRRPRRAARRAARGAAGTPAVRLRARHARRPPASRCAFASSATPTAARTARACSACSRTSADRPRRASASAS